MPHAPSINAITVFSVEDPDKEGKWDQNALYFQLEEGKKCIVDRSYTGEPSKAVITKGEHSSDLKEFLAQAKNHQETFHCAQKLQHTWASLPSWS